MVIHIRKTQSAGTPVYARLNTIFFFKTTKNKQPKQTTENARSIEVIGLSRKIIKMGKSQDKAHLSPTERNRIATLYNEGGETYRSLAKQFGVSYSTVYRIIKELNVKESSKGIIEGCESPPTEPTEPPPSTEPPTEPPKEYIEDPIAFRRSKLCEIAGDIMSTRLRGSVQVLPSLHRLHLQVHDELTQMKEEREELDSVMNPEELLHTIAIAAAGLPPILKDKLQELITNDFTNVIPFQANE